MLKPLLGMYVAFIVTTLSIVLYRYFMTKYRFNSGVRSFFGYTEKIPLIGFLSVVAGAMVSVIFFSWGRFNTIIIILSAIVIFILSTLSREGRIHFFSSFIIKTMLLILIANHIFFNIGMNDGDGLSGMLKVFLLSLYFLASSYIYHLLDESEGLVIRIFSINMAVIGLVSILNNNSYLAIASFSFSGASIALARFNTSPSRFISGHTGSEALGYILAVMLALCFFIPTGNNPLTMDYSIIAIASVNLLPGLILIKKSLFIIDNNLTSNRFFGSKGIIYGIKQAGNRIILSRISVILALFSIISVYFGFSITIALYSITLISIISFNIALRLNSAVRTGKLIRATQYQASMGKEAPEKEEQETEILLT
jgi:UDP-N-acetylmuramyl pentapeptide phosphotransferase/UDP-N-acetylglucosamine-1-phosphate transferase